MTLKTNSLIDKYSDNPEIVEKRRIFHTLMAIIRYECKLDQIQLSGSNDHMLFKHFNNQIKLDIEYNPEDWMAGYRHKFTCRLPGFFLVIFKDPIEHFRAACRIHIYPDDDIKLCQLRGFLEFINTLTKGRFFISQAEYATDFICPASSEVSKLFEVMRKYLYVPYQRHARSFGGAIPLIGDKQMRTSRVYQIGGKLKIVRDRSMLGSVNENDTINQYYFVVNTRLYERGQDNKKIHNRWLEKDFDRVRLEHIIFKEQFNNSGIIAFNDFIKQPYPDFIGKTFLQFKYFKSLSINSIINLPKKWDEYVHTDENNQAGGFQIEYNHYKNKYNNIRQYCVPEEYLTKVMRRVNIKWEHYFFEWQLMNYITAAVPSNIID